VAALPDTRRVTVAGDKNYDTKGFVRQLRDMVAEFPRVRSADGAAPSRTSTCTCSPVPPNRRKPCRVAMRARQSVTTSDTPASDMSPWCTIAAATRLPNHSRTIDGDADLV
jgi:hypothetical protein